MSKEWTYGLVHQGDLRTIEKKEVVVGRSRTCDIRIGEPSVSRKHFRLLVGEGVVTLQDLGSSNGTYVNDGPVHDRQDLEHGDRVTVGDIDVFVHIERKADTRPFVGLETRALNRDELDALTASSSERSSEPVDDADDDDSKPDLPAPPAPPPAAADTWPIDEGAGPDEAEFARAMDAAAATSSGPQADDPAHDVAVTRDMPTSLATQRFDADALPQPSLDAPSADIHGTRLVEQNILDAASGPDSLWSTPPPPASITPPPIEFMPAPTIPDAVGDGASDSERDDPSPALPDDLDATGAPRRPPRQPPSSPPARALDPAPGWAPQPTVPARQTDLADLPLTAARAGATDGDVLGTVAGFDQTHIGVTGVTGATTPASEPSEAPPPRPAVRERSGIHARPPAAGFWLRGFAVLADAAWATALGWGLARLLGTADDPITRQSAYALAFFVATLVVVVGWSVWGTTPGKRLFRLYVCTTAGQPGIGPLRALVRAVGYLVSVLTLGIGFLIAASGNKRALHDRLAGTYVARLG